MQRLRHIAPVLAIFALAALVGTAVFAQTWTGRGRLQGQITDDNGKGLEATLVLTFNGEEGVGPEPVVTKPNGSFVIGGLGHGQWKIVVSAPGFVPREGMMAVNEFGNAGKVNMNLRPIPTEVIEQEAAKQGLGLIDEGNKLLEQEKYAEARAKYEEALGEMEAENHPPILRGIARAHYQEGHVEQAIGTLEKALEMAPDDVDTLRLVVNLMVAEGREADAEAYIAKLPEGETLDPNSLLNLGIKAFNENDLPKALDYFNRVVAENPNLADAYYYRGLSQMNQGQNEGAIADFEKLLEIDPGHASAAEAEAFLEYLKGL